MTAPLIPDVLTPSNGVEVPAAVQEPKEKPALRTRKRPARPNVEGREDEIAQRVRKFFDEDRLAHRADLEARIQRHAKFRQWVDDYFEGRWQGSSNVGLGDIAAVVFNTEDTLQNAVLSTRPVVVSKATDESNRERERKIDLLHDYQVFLEQDGEKLFEDLSCDFIREGSFKALTIWIHETRKNTQERRFEAIDPVMSPRDYFASLIDQHFAPTQKREIPDSGGWDWRVLQGKDWVNLRFYTDPRKADEVICEIDADDLVVYDGPKTIRYEYENCLYPYWCENLQSPGPSNPRGAGHVILVDYPTLDEVRRLVRNGTYDRLTLEDLEQYTTDQSPNSIESNQEKSIERAKDAMRGFSSSTYSDSGMAEEHGTVCRLKCFDLWSSDPGEDAEDVVWTVLLGPDRLARAQPLGEVAPGNPPRRPIQTAAMIPIPGRVDGIGVIELMERMHDFKKEVFDLMVDGSELEMIPWFTYRQTSMVNPEEYAIYPGAGWPVTQNDDIKERRFAAQSGAVGINLLALADKQQQDLTMVGDLQLGRIPTGKSSALRTSGGISQVLAQGEARPERILRRFFRGIRDIYACMWNLNRHYLSDEKTFRVMGIGEEDESILSIKRREDFSSPMQFEFVANVLNASKVAMQQGMETILTMMLNPLAIQLGLSDPDSIYRILSDYLTSLGQRPEKYLNKPTPESDQPRILAVDALNWLHRGELPVGIPAEGSAEAHLQALDEVLNRPLGEGVVADFFRESPVHLQLLQAYIQQVRQRALQERQQAQMQQAAAELQTQLTQQGGRGQTGPQQPQAPIIERGDVIDESLPSSGTPQ